MEDLSNACSLVLGDLSENAGVDEPRSRHELPSGWYSHSVLAKAFDLLSTPEWRLLPAVARPSEWTRFFDPRVKGCLVNQDNQHWVSIKSHGDRVLLFDSEKSGPIFIDEQGYRNIIPRHRMTSWVVKHDCDLE